MKTSIKIRNLVMAIVMAVLFGACAKSTSSTGATGYPSIDVTCGGQTCVK